MMRPGIEPRSPGPLANTLPTRPMSQLYLCRNQWIWLLIWCEELERCVGVFFCVIFHLSSSSSCADSTLSLSSLSIVRDSCIQCPHRTDVFAGWPTLVCPCVGVHRRITLMSLSLFLQQGPACLFHLTWMVCEMGSWVVVQLFFCGVLFPRFVQKFT